MKDRRTPNVCFIPKSDSLWIDVAGCSMFPCVLVSLAFEFQQLSSVKAAAILECSNNGIIHTHTRAHTQPSAVSVRGTDSLTKYHRSHCVMSHKKQLPKQSSIAPTSEVAFSASFTEHCFNRPLMWESYKPLYSCYAIAECSQCECILHLTPKHLISLDSQHFLCQLKHWQITTKHSVYAWHFWLSQFSLHYTQISPKDSLMNEYSSAILA